MSKLNNKNRKLQLIICWVQACC